jgi:hypothetical protein
MKNKAIQGLLLGFLLVFVNFTNPALSQEQPQFQQGVMRLPIMVDCGPSEVMMKAIVTEYKELPFAQMLVSFTAPNGQVLSGWGKIWVNAETRTWSYVVTFPDSDQVCYFLGGKDFGPTDKGQPS